MKKILFSIMTFLSLSITGFCQAQEDVEKYFDGMIFRLIYDDYTSYRNYAYPSTEVYIDLIKALTEESTETLTKAQLAFSEVEYAKDYSENIEAVFSVLNNDRYSVNIINYKVEDIIDINGFKALNHTGDLIITKTDTYTTTKFSFSELISINGRLYGGVLEKVSNFDRVKKEIKKID